MTRQLDVGISLPALSDLTQGGRASAAVAAAARHVEDLGFSALWVPDLIIGDGTPALESVVTAAVAASVTERIGIGFGVLVLPLRPVAWTAAQIATLQQLSGDRVLLGVGAGGFPGTPFWRAAGGPAAGRGARADAALDVLPRLIAGQPAAAGEDGAVLTLAPAARVPPILIGGNSPAAMRRAAARGLGWFPSLLTPAALRRQVPVLRQLAAGHGQVVPEVTVGGHAMIGTGAPVRSARQAFVRELTGTHGMPADQAAAVPLAGSVGEVAGRLAAYAAAGAARMVLALDGPDWMRQCELLAEARARLS